MDRKLNQHIELKGKLVSLKKGQYLSGLTYNEYRSILSFAKTLDYKLRGATDENGKHTVLRIR